MWRAGAHRLQLHITRTYRANAVPRKGVLLVHVPRRMGHLGLLDPAETGASPAVGGYGPDGGKTAQMRQGSDREAKDALAGVAKASVLPGAPSGGHTVLSCP